MHNGGMGRQPSEGKGSSIKATVSASTPGIHFQKCILEIYSKREFPRFLETTNYFTFLIYTFLLQKCLLFECMWTVFAYLPDETSPTFFQPQHGRRISCPVLQCSLHLRYLIRDPREWILRRSALGSSSPLISSPCLWLPLFCCFASWERMTTWFQTRRWSNNKM